MMKPTLHTTVHKTATIAGDGRKLNLLYNVSVFSRRTMSRTIFYDNGEYALSLKPQDEVTRAICKYIDEHPQEDLSYKRLQKLFYVSRYHLGTKFPQQTGKTLTRYVIFKRLLRTCELARDGMGIEAAAYQSGFNTYSHFYNEFKRNFGISPKEYLEK